MVRKPDGTQLLLKAKDHILLARSQTLIIRTAGGGGYGDPKKRDAQRLAQDIENGYVTGDVDEIYMKTES
jgi:N-methylhydantoinase B